MSNKVLIIQSNITSAKILVDFFSKRGDKVWLTTNIPHAFALFKNENPDLVILDLHMTGNQWLSLLNLIHQKNPDTQVIVTNKHPDLKREMLAKDQGVRVFLREPFSPQWIENALQKLKLGAPPDRSSTLPKVRVPMRIKIILPYILLTLVFAFASAYLITQYVLESFRDRYTNQLIDAGKVTSDWMVKEEDRILNNIRLLANTEGVPELVESGDATHLRDVLLPVAINYQEEDIEILDLRGIGLISLRHRAGSAREDYEAFQGDTNFADEVFVKKIIQQQIDPIGDKFAELVHVPWGDLFYIAGPILKSDGKTVGVILIGKSITSLIRQIRQDTLAHITIYNKNDGNPIASTLFLQKDIYPVPSEMVNKILLFQDKETNIRPLKVASTNYSEILGPWEARWGEDLGVIGVALSENFLIQPAVITKYQVFLFVSIAILGIIVIGILVARQITQPLAKVVQASVKVAQGNLEVKVSPEGNDEVAVLAHAFNYMVSGLQEGFIYRDLLGRTVSPEVREALRHSFSTGNLRLEGQNTVATVLMSDIRDFTRISEKEEPTTILHWLNEYFGEIVPIITRHNGVVDKFEGDAMLAFFGILPTPLSPKESTYHACKAALKMLATLERINSQRAMQEEPSLITGISINTGMLIAGSLGTSDRLNYTIIGDTVNTTQRMQEINRSFGESGIVVSENTLVALGDRRAAFRFEPLGEHALKGKMDMLWVYRMWPKDTELKL